MRAAFVYILDKFPSFKRIVRVVRRYLFYVNLQGEDAVAEGQRLLNSWQNDALPRRQRKLVDKQLRQYRSGARIDAFNVFVDSVCALPDLAPGSSLLEVGCSSGFYSEVVEIAGLQVQYSGCDYSDAFICLAREKYPAVAFEVEDATALSYPDCSFDVVVSGCCLLHIPEYVKGVEEAVRVASRYVIFHRTPVVFGQPEQWYRKQAYGVETVEIHFNEAEFLALLDRNGLELVATLTLSEEYTDVSRTRGGASRTYVCRKRKQ